MHQKHRPMQEEKTDVTESFTEGRRLETIPNSRPGLMRWGTEGPRGMPNRATWGPRPAAK